MEKLFAAWYMNYMKILILSDSHQKANFLDFIDQFPQYLVICLGDYCIPDTFLKERNVLFIKGNCDYGTGPRYKMINVKNKKFLFTHGHAYQVKINLNALFKEAVQQDCDFCLFGHTHIPFYTYKKGIHFINPGAFYEGSYVIIEDMRVSFYKNKTKIKEYKL